MIKNTEFYEMKGCFARLERAERKISTLNKQIEDTLARLQDLKESMLRSYHGYDLVYCLDNDIFMNTVAHMQKLKTKADNLRDNFERCQREIRNAEYRLANALDRYYTEEQRQAALPAPFATALDAALAGAEEKFDAGQVIIQPLENEL